MLVSWGCGSGEVVGWVASGAAVLVCGLSAAVGLVFVAEACVAGSGEPCVAA